MEVRSVSSQEIGGLGPVSARAPASQTGRTEGPSVETPISKTRPEFKRSQASPKTASTAHENAGLQQTGTRLRIDSGSKRVVAQIVDENNQVIKQIPPEALLRISARFAEVTGRLFDQEA